MYRHSVWIDVFGIVALCALLLVPLGMLAAEMMGGSSGAGGGVVASRGGGATAPPRSGLAPGRSSRPAPRSAPWAAAHGARSEGPGSAVPFSKSWREQATPSLTGPSDRSRNGGQSFKGGSGAAASKESNERLAFGTDGGSRRTSFGHRSGSAGDGGAGWQQEANRLAGRARALSSQLGALQRESEARGTARSERQPAGESASGRTRVTAKDNPPLPPPVPIDDHLHWLLVAGILWGAWRIGRGG